MSMWDATLGAACCLDSLSGPSDLAAAAAAVSAAAAASAWACACDKWQRAVTLAFRSLSGALPPWGNLPSACTLLGMHVADPDSTS